MRGKDRFLLVCWLTTLGLLVPGCTPAAAPAPTYKQAEPAAKSGPSSTPAASFDTKQVALTPTAKPAAEQPKYGGALSISAHEPVGHYDIYQNSTLSGVQPFQHAYNNLVQYDPQQPSRIISDLARGWEVGGEGTVYTFKLRKGVKWHDGRPFTSADAKFSLDRMYSPPKGVLVPKVGELMTAIKEVEAPDLDTAKVTLKYASASFLPALATTWAAMFPKHIIEEKGDMKRTIVGTGPFKFKSDVPDNSFEVVKNKEYFKEGRPYLDAITYYIIKDPATRFAAFRTKRVQMTYPIYGFIPAQLEQVKRELPEVSTAQFEGATFIGYYFPLTKGPWNGLKVRRAISLAIDRQEAVRTVEGGIGVVAGPMPPGPWALPDAEVSKMPGYRQPKDEDRAEAKKLLAEAGPPDGLKFTLLYRAGSAYETAAQFFKDQMAKIGVEVSIKPIDSNLLYDVLNRRDYDAAQMKLSWTLHDPDDIILQYYRSKAVRNYGDFGDPEIDRLIDEQARTLDEGKRKEVVNALQKLIIEKVPFVHSHWGNYVMGWRPEVKNYAKPLGIYTYGRLEDVWLAK